MAVVSASREIAMGHPITSSILPSTVLLRHASRSNVSIRKQLGQVHPLFHGISLLAKYTSAIG